MPNPQIKTYRDYQQIGTTLYSTIFRAKIDVNGSEHIIHVFHGLRKIKLFEKMVTTIKEVKQANFPSYVTHGEGQYNGKNVPFLALEFIDGISWDDYLSLEGVPLYEASLRWGYELTEAISFLHEKNIYHGNLNPKNIVITTKSEDNQKICILGLETALLYQYAKEENKNYPYMSPVAVNSTQRRKLDKKIRFENDIYALAILCYEFFNYKYPFNGTEDFISSEHWQVFHKGKKQVSSSQIKISEDLSLKFFDKVLSNKAPYPTAKEINTLFRNKTTGRPCHIAIVGSRGSGKTCYITSLANDVVGKTSKNLRYNYKRLYEYQQLPDATILSNYDYQFRMQIPRKEHDTSCKYSQYYQETDFDRLPCFEVVTRDYGGELLAGRAIDNHEGDKEERNQLYEFFQLSHGLIIMIETRIKEDVGRQAEIGNEIQDLLERISLVDREGKMQLNIPIAIVLTKWDRHSYMFNLSIKERQSLNSKILSDAILEKFKGANSTLSKSAKIEVGSDNNYWSIQDGESRYDIFSIAGKHIFTVESKSYLEEIKKGRFSNDLHKEFTTYKHPISDDIELAEKKEEDADEFTKDLKKDQEWELIDKESGRKFTLRFSKNELMVYIIDEKLNVYEMSWDASIEKQKAISYIEANAWLNDIYNKFRNAESIINPEIFPVYSFIGDRPSGRNVRFFNINSPLVWVAEQTQNCILAKCRNFARKNENDLRKVIDNYRKVLETENLLPPKGEKIKEELENVQQKYFEQLEEKWKSREQRTHENFLQLTSVFQTLEKTEGNPNRDQKISQWCHEYSKWIDNQSWMEKKSFYFDLVEHEAVPNDIKKKIKKKLRSYSILVAISSIGILVLAICTLYFGYHTYKSHAAHNTIEQIEGYLVSIEINDSQKSKFDEQIAYLKFWNSDVIDYSEWLITSPSFFRNEILLKKLNTKRDLLAELIGLMSLSKMNLEIPTALLSENSDTLSDIRKKLDIITQLSEGNESVLQKTKSKLLAKTKYKFLVVLRNLHGELINKVRDVRNQLYESMIARLKFNIIYQKHLPQFTFSVIELQENQKNITRWQKDCANCYVFLNDKELYLKAKDCKDILDKIKELNLLNKSILLFSIQSEKLKDIIAHSKKEINAQSSLESLKELRKDIKIDLEAKNVVYLDKKLDYKILQQTDRTKLGPQLAAKISNYNFNIAELKLLLKECNTYIYLGIIKKYQREFSGIQPNAGTLLNSVDSNLEEIKILWGFFQEETKILTTSEKLKSILIAPKKDLKSLKDKIKKHLQQMKNYNNNWKDLVSQLQNQQAKEFTCPYNAACVQIKIFSEILPTHWGKYGGWLNTHIKHIELAKKTDEELFNDIERSISKGDLISAKKKINMYLSNNDIVRIKRKELTYFLRNAKVKFKIKIFMATCKNQDTFFGEKPQIFFEYNGSLHTETLDQGPKNLKEHCCISVEIPLAKDEYLFSTQIWEDDLDIIFGGSGDDDCGILKADIYSLMGVKYEENQERMKLNAVEHNHSYNGEEILIIEFRKAGENKIQPTFPKYGYGGSK